VRTVRLGASRFTLAISLLLSGTSLSAVMADTPEQAADAPAAAAPVGGHLQPLGDQPARLWTDAAGQRQASATLVAASASDVSLKKASGESLVIPLSALCADDRAYVSRLLAALNTHSSASKPHEVYKVEIPATAPESESTQIASPLPGNMMYVRISGDLLAKQVGREVRYRTEIVDNILGTAIRGTGDIAGKTDLVLFSHADGVRGELRLSGQMHARTTGYNGPVQVGSRSVTHFNSAKAIVLDEKGLRVGPAVTSARTRSTTTGISSNLGGLGDRIARNRASGEVAARRPAADRIAAEHASEKINRRFDAQVAERINELKSLPANSLGVAPDHPLKPQSYRCKTAGDFIYIAVLGDCSNEESMAPPPSWSRSSAGLELYVHAAAVERAMADRDLQQSLKPLLERVAGAMTSQIHAVGAAPAATEKEWDSVWSDDRQWLRLSWYGEKLPSIARLPKSATGKIR